MIKNNKQTIEKTLKSISNLNAKLLIGNLGSTDGTLDICKKYNAEIIEVKNKNDLSKARNDLILPGMNFYLEPWEILASGEGSVIETTENRKVYVIQNGILSKEIRIWKDAKFKNPAYETIDVDDAECDPSIVISSIGNDNLIDEKIKICQEWITNRPTLSDASYYYAFSKLYKRDYISFVLSAEKYLAMSATGISVIMVHYNLAKVKFHMGRPSEAIKHLLICLSSHPTFAEFWCLLADMLFKQGRYSKAKSIYQNALILGQRRLSSDSYPIEISKYESYPKGMMQKCEEMEKEISIIKSQNQ